MAAEPSRRVLHVGCGLSKIATLPPGFRDGSWSEVRLDIDPGVRPDIVGTITDMANVPSASFDAIFSSHNLEHVFAHEVLPTLIEFRRVLNNTGFVVITCPDLQTLGEHITTGNLLDPLYTVPAGAISVIDVLYGHSAAIARGEAHMAHHTGFSLNTLVEHCRDASFGGIIGKRRPKYFDLWVIATKSPRKQHEMIALAQAYTFSDPRR